MHEMMAFCLKNALYISETEVEGHLIFVDKTESDSFRAI